MTTPDTFFKDIDADPLSFRVKADIINHPRKYTLEDYCQHFDYTPPTNEMPDGWSWARPFFDTLKSIYKPFLPKFARAADLKSRVLGEFRHTQPIDRALTYRHVDPEFRYGAVMMSDGDCDFEWSQQWEDKARPSMLVRTFPSPNFHAQWFCTEFLSRSDRRIVQYYLKVKFGVDCASSGNLITSPIFNKPRRKNLELRNKNGNIEPWADECFVRFPPDATVYSKAELFALLGIKTEHVVMGDGLSAKIITKPVASIVKMFNKTINPCLHMFLKDLVSLSPRQKAIAILNYESSVEEGQRFNNMRDVTCTLAYRLFHTDEWCFENVLDIASHNSSDLPDNEVKSLAQWVFKRAEAMKWEKNGEKPYDVNVRWRIAREECQLQTDYARETLTPLSKVYYWVKKGRLVSYLSRWMKKDEYENTLIAQDIVTGSEVENKFDLKERELPAVNISRTSPLYPYTYPDQSKRLGKDETRLSEKVTHKEVQIDPPIPPPIEFMPPPYALADEFAKTEWPKMLGVFPSYEWLNAAAERLGLRVGLLHTSFRTQNVASTYDK